METITQVLIAAVGALIAALIYVVRTRTASESRDDNAHADTVSADAMKDKTLSRLLIEQNTALMRIQTDYSQLLIRFGRMEGDNDRLREEIVRLKSAQEDQIKQMVAERAHSASLEKEKITLNEKVRVLEANNTTLSLRVTELEDQLRTLRTPRINTMLITQETSSD